MSKRTHPRDRAFAQISEAFNDTNKSLMDQARRLRRGSLAEVFESFYGHLCAEQYPTKAAAFEAGRLSGVSDAWAMIRTAVERWSGAGPPPTAPTDGKKARGKRKGRVR